MPCQKQPSPSDFIETADRPHATLACGKLVGMKATGPSSSPHTSFHLCRSSRCTLSNRKRAPLQRCSFWTVRDLHWQRRKRKEGVFQVCACAQHAACGAMCGRARQDSSCSLSRCFPCALPTDTRRSPRLASARLQETAVCTLVVQFWPIQIQMLCYLEVAWGRIDQLRGLDLLNVYCTGWQKNRPHKYNVQYNVI